MTPSDFLSEPFDPARIGALEAQDQDAIHAAGRPPAMATSAATAGALSTGAAALGGMAVGALVVGALAIGALAIGRLSVGKARFRRLEIDELIVHRVSEGNRRR
ncbi:hypothetical protein [Caulobacter sp. UNC279MFTsu5.1]|uniref:hypothetical protein n=1 Tax=Caulobacter sp. UNC279MFTsu5.1 TaxID=1502775 RepID=UPI0008EB0E64|nr:hypothetical protein [Caulobacter sp. UNC279MFTsu5.1]SFJ18286.1 hypothetical protein SAMN02799626_01282 [Caulobacter sp. UNC279MFTsu5.1]